jgi:hypothetical protein
MIAIVLYAYTSWKYYYHIQVKCLIKAMLSKDNATLHKKDALPPTWSNVTWNEIWDICTTACFSFNWASLSTCMLVPDLFVQAVFYA